MTTAIEHHLGIFVPKVNKRDRFGLTKMLDILEEEDS
jgi:hypothetical protein